MQEGIDLANDIGRTMNKFDLVVTSKKIRTFETAIAMGYEVHHEIANLGILPTQVFNEISWPNMYSNIANIVSNKQASRNFAKEQLFLWLSIAKQLPKDGNGLIISHGGIIELASILASPDSDFYKWGGALGYCEGIKLLYNDGVFQEAKLLRLPDEKRIISND
jgi:broad specificity phosphatase PhoE